MLVCAFHMSVAGTRLLQWLDLEIQSSKGASASFACYLVGGTRSRGGHLTVLGNAWIAFQFEMDFCICLPRIRQRKPRTNICCSSHPLHYFLWVSVSCVLAGGVSSLFHMTTLLITRLWEWKTLASLLQLPVPVLKSAFVSPAYSQWNQGHVEMLIFLYREIGLASPICRGRL